MTAVAGFANVAGDPDVERVFPLGSWDRKPQRTIEREWLVFEDDDGSKVFVQLDCDHYKGRGYWAAVRNPRRHPDGITSTIHGADTQYTVLSEPDPGRYNKRRLEAFADVALARFRELAADGVLDRFLRGERAPTR